MADALPPLEVALLEPLSRALGDAATGSQLTGLFVQVGLHDPLGDGNTKWKRICAAFTADQQRYQHGNRVLMFVKAVMAPARFVGAESASLEAIRAEVNQSLAFAGYYVRDDGRLAQTTRAKTLPEAQQRASKLRAELCSRRVHADVLRFCTAELVVPNYFHAVFEATKSVADKLRTKTGLGGDGAELVDAALGLGKTNHPQLAFNTLQTETERTEQKGLAMLFKGMFGTFRNVTAHAPKISWEINEQDALDLLTLASFLHRRLDAAASTGVNTK